MAQKRKSKNIDVRPFGGRLEGYTFLDAPGGRAKYVYTGEYYSPTLSDRDFRLRKLLYCLLSLCAILSFLFTGIMKIRSNNTGFIGFVNCLLILVFLWLIYVLVVFVSHNRKLTIWAYRVTVLQLGLAALAGGILLLLSAVFALFWAITQKDGSALLHLLSAALRLFGAAALFFMIYLKRGTEYTVSYPSQS